jgi:hypothetical protein
MTLEEEEAVQQELWELQTLVVSVPWDQFFHAEHTFKGPQESIQLPTVPTGEITKEGNQFLKFIGNTTSLTSVAETGKTILRAKPERVQIEA